MSTEPLTVDFDRLEVGTRVVTRGRTITETDLVSFSALTGDWHPQHADAEWAAASPFGERIAHGMLVLSYGVGLLPIDPERVVALRGLRNVVFKRPVPIGCTISVEAEIAGLQAPGSGPRPGRARASRSRRRRQAGRPRLARGAVAAGALRGLQRERRSGRECEQLEGGDKGLQHRDRRALPVRGWAGAGLVATSPLLEGKRLLLTGVITRKSIAFAVAEEAQRAGAEVVLTGFGRTRRMTERAAARLPETADVLELDVNDESDLAAVAADLDSRWGSLDGVLHAIAFAPADALGGEFLHTPAESAIEAFRTSAYSLQALGRHLAPLLERDGGGGIVGLDFDASVAWPVYDWMGVAKAALESTARYLARDLGPRGIRVNLLSAGPIETAAAGGIPGFDELAGAWQRGAPLGWDQSDPTPVARAVCFLLSDWAAAISGEVLHADGGFHALGAAGLGAAAKDRAEEPEPEPEPEPAISADSARTSGVCRHRAAGGGRRSARFAPGGRALRAAPLDIN